MTWNAIKISTIIFKSK